MSKRSHEALICDSHLSLLDADVKGCVLWSVNLTILDIYGTLSQPQHEDGLHSSAVCKSKTADMSKIQIWYIVFKTHLLLGGPHLRPDVLSLQPLTRHCAWHTSKNASAFFRWPQKDRLRAPRHHLHTSAPLSWSTCSGRTLGWADVVSLKHYFYPGVKSPDRTEQLCDIERRNKDVRTAAQRRRNKRRKVETS